MINLGPELDLLINNSLDLIYIHDLRGRIIDVNHSFIIALGYNNKKKIQALTLNQIIKQKNFQSKKINLTKFLKLTVKRNQYMDYMLKKSDGQYLYVRGFGIPLKSQNGNIIIQFAHDFSEKEVLQKKLNKSQEELKKLSTIFPEIRLWSLSQKKNSLELLYKSGKKLYEHERRYQEILNNIKEAYFEFDIDENLIFFNNSLCKILGYSHEELINKPLSSLLDEGSYNILTNLNVTEIPDIPFEFKIIKKNGEKITIETSITKKYDLNNNIIGYFGIFRDITERKKIEDLQNKFREKLEREVKRRTRELHNALNQQKLLMNEILKRSQFKSEFMSMISHELRTPLNSIIGFSDLLLEQVYGTITKKQLEFINDIKNSAQHQFDMIEHILNISKIESGQISLNLQKFSLNTIVEQVISNLKPFYHKKKLKVKVKGLEEEKYIYADPIRFKEILLNLMSNAIKFTIEGYITLKVQEKWDHWIFKVKDTGIGIDHKDFKIIFKEFKRVDSAYVHSVPGTGLGLSLTKRLVELHGGSITFTSLLGSGTTFIFTIAKKLKD